MALPANQAAPSTAAIALASAILAGVIGYFIGQFSTLGTVTNDYSKSPGKAKHSDAEDEDEDEDEEEENEAVLVGKQKFSRFTGDTEECKLVLVVRTDLGMTKGTQVQPFEF